MPRHFVLLMLLSLASVTQRASAQYPGGSASSLIAEGRYYPGPSTRPELIDVRLGLNAPIYRGPNDLAVTTANLGRLSLLDSTRFCSGRRLPAELTRVELGGQYSRRFANGRDWGARGAIGYAGDKPFGSGEDLTYSLAGTYGFTPSPRGRWMVMVLMSNNGVLPNFIPIPGFSYSYRSGNFTGVFGLPVLSLNWSPRPWTLSITAFGPLVRAEVALGDPNGWQGLVDFALTRQMFIEARRERDRDRLSVGESRASVGGRGRFGPLMTELKIGWAFAREVSVRRGVFERAGELTSLPDDAFANAQLSYAY